MAGQQNISPTILTLLIFGSGSRIVAPMVLRQSKDLESAKQRDLTPGSKRNGAVTAKTGNNNLTNE